MDESAEDDGGDRPLGPGQELVDVEEAEKEPHEAREDRAEAVVEKEEGVEEVNLEVVGEVEAGGLAASIRGQKEHTEAVQHRDDAAVAHVK